MTGKTRSTNKTIRTPYRSYCTLMMFFTTVGRCCRPSTMSKTNITYIALNCAEIINVKQETRNYRPDLNKKNNNMRQAHTINNECVYILNKTVQKTICIYISKIKTLTISF